MKIPVWKVFLAVSVFVVGSVALYVSREVEGWLQDFLLNAGSGFLLFSPLYGVQLGLESRVESNTRQVEQVRQELAQDISSLRGDFAAREEQQAAEIYQAVEGIAKQPSASSVRQVLDDALAERVISWKGVRVKVVNRSAFVYVRFSGALAIGAGVRVTVERRSGEPIDSWTWGVDETPADLMSRIARVLRRESLYPGESFDPSFAFAQLQETIETARAEKNRYALVEDLSDVVEFCSPQWLVCEWGIAGLAGTLQPYWIARGALDESDWESHMRGKPWLDEQSFREALGTAQALERAGFLSG